MKVKINSYGFYERVEMPSVTDVEKMYGDQYYQGEAGKTSYSAQYSDQEKRGFLRNAMKKDLILKHFLQEERKKNILDIGCGEGYVLKYFYEKGWDVTGIDLSEYGIMTHNSDMREFLQQGDCNEILEKMAEQEQKFDVVNSDLFLEACVEPVRTLMNIKSIIKAGTGIVLIRVGNYLSPLHKELLRRRILQEDMWFDRVGNYSYFGKDSLEKLLREIGFESIGWYGDTFVDFNLLNPRTYYYGNSAEEVGKTCYKAMLDIEDIIESESLEKMVELEKVMGDLGLGRHITCVCKRTS